VFIGVYLWFNGIVPAWRARFSPDRKTPFLAWIGNP
jgi:hypothetical protein